MIRSTLKNVKIEVSQPELLLVVTLMSDQLFRREFIDPKMPGYKGNPAELAMGNELGLRLKSVFRQVSEPPSQSGSRRYPTHSSCNPNGIPNAFTPQSFTPASVRSDDLPRIAPS